MTPKRAFVTFINEKYQPLVERLIESINLFSKYPIIVYTFNFDYVPVKDNVYTKRLDDEKLEVPVFEKFGIQSDEIGIVDRSDINTYYTLSRKSVILLDVLKNGLEEGIFLDADGLVSETIDDSFEYLKDCTDYPLIGKGLFEYMMLYGKGNPFISDTLEMPIMNLFGIKNRSMHYVQTNFIVFNKNCIEFFKECTQLANDPHILRHNLFYAPYHDETIMNVLLWKRNAIKHLPLVHFNINNCKSIEDFYDSPIDSFLNNSYWHYIPKDKNDIKLFHGCKSPSELDKSIDYLKNKKISKPDVLIKNNNKITIVTLFDKNYEVLSKLSIPNKIEYANKHGYEFIYFDKIIDSNRPAQWSKVKAIEYALKNTNPSWVWWIDIDALIMDFDVKLESIIDENYDIIFTENKFSYLSNGSSFFKNTLTSCNFLEDCYDLKKHYLKDIDVQIFDHEQQSMRALIKNDYLYKSRTKLINERVCNSYCFTENHSVLSSYPNWNNEPNIYQPGDFIIQFSGRSIAERIDIMSDYYSKVKK